MISRSFANWLAILYAPIGYFFAFLAAKYGVQSPVSSALAFSLSRLLITAPLLPLTVGVVAAVVFAFGKACNDKLSCDPDAV